MTDSADELMKSYEVIRSVIMRHSQYDAAMILTLVERASRKARCKSSQGRSHTLATPTLCDAVRDMMNAKQDPQFINALLKKRKRTMN
jgi:hypothetical protein